MSLYNSPHRVYFRKSHGLVHISCLSYTHKANQAGYMHHQDVVGALEVPRISAVASKHLLSKSPSHHKQAQCS